MQLCTTKKEEENWIIDDILIAESQITCLWAGRISVLISCKCSGSPSAPLSSCLMRSGWGAVLQVGSSRINMWAGKADVSVFEADQGAVSSTKVQINGRRLQFRETR